MSIPAFRLYLQELVRDQLASLENVVRQLFRIIDSKNEKIENLRGRVRALRNQKYEAEIRANEVEDKMITLQREMSAVLAENRVLRARVGGGDPEVVTLE